MAKSRKPRKQAKGRIGGPYLSAAFFCESVIEEKSDQEGLGGMMSALRIHDNVTLRAMSPLPHGARPIIKLSGLLGFKAGDSTDNHTFSVIGNAPDGKRKALISDAPIKFPKGLGNERGSNIKIGVTMELAGDGLYWFDVLLDGRLVTKIPMRLTIETAQQETPRGKG